MSKIDTRFKAIARDETRCYFVYRHLRADTGDLFYIGYGKKRKRYASYKTEFARAFEITKRSGFWDKIFKKHGREVEIVLDNLTYEEAVAKEIELIALYGRYKNGGILCNLTDGGEGSLNFKHSPESLAKMKLKALPLEDKLLYTIDNESGCWNWEGNYHLTTMPVIHVDGCNRFARRFVYCLYKNTSLKKNQHAHNKCNNFRCINPDHTEIHMAAKAIRDKSPFVEADIINIRQLASKGTTHADIARKYNVRRPIITKILNGTNWSWLKAEGVPDTVKSDYHSKHKKPVMCIDTGEIFASAKEASLAKFNTDKYLRPIRTVCNRGYTYYKGFNFKFA